MIQGFSRTEKPKQRDEWPEETDGRASVKNPRSLFLLDFALDQATGHLYADAQHGLGHFHMLALQKGLGILGEIQSHQRTLVFSPAQLDTAVWQLDNF
ncbi:hypothetical protein P308_10235 [Pseudomonas piscis]|nr:hypothetical protein P308_10235 [Pseudomonas piscis]